MDCEFIGWCALDASQQASWIQAVGSIAAILVAVAVPAWQRSQQRSDEKRKELRESKSLASALLDTVARYREYADLFQRQLTAAIESADDGFQNKLFVPSELQDARRELHLLGAPGGNLLRALYYTARINELHDYNDFLWREDYAAATGALNIVLEEIDSTLRGMHELLQ